MKLSYAFLITLAAIACAQVGVVDAAHMLLYQVGQKRPYPPHSSYPQYPLPLRANARPAPAVPKIDLTQVERHADGTFHCPHPSCPKTSPTSGGIKNHYAQRHCRPVKYDCPVEGCGSKLASPARLDTHIVSMHPGAKEALFICSSCRKRFDNYELCKHHVHFECWDGSSVIDNRTAHQRAAEKTVAQVLAEMLPSADLPPLAEQPTSIEPLPHDN